MSLLRVLLAILLLLSPGRTGEAGTFDHQHTAWTDILHMHVQDVGAISRVNYPALKADRAWLDSYLEGLSGVSREEFDVWTAPQQLAFRINAYNAFTA